MSILGCILHHISPENQWKKEIKILIANLSAVINMLNMLSYNT